METCKIKYYNSNNTNSVFVPHGTSTKSKDVKSLKPQHMRFCNDTQPIGANNPNYISANQRLAGPANPKTHIKPVIAPPCADIDFWRSNNLINHSHINTESQTDTYLSGYEVSNFCDNIDACIGPSDMVKDNIEGFEKPTYIGFSDKKYPVPGQFNPLKNNTHIKSPTPSTNIERYAAVRENKLISDGYEGYSCNGVTKSPNLTQHLQHVDRQIVSPTPVTTRNSTNFNENFEIPFIRVRDNESGLVNTSCGYNPEQVIKSNLPSNMEAGNCEKSEEMKQYNKNLFTQTLQPGIYTHNEIIEPINANIGISFTQQFEPKTSKRDEYGNLIYTEHDPRIYNPEITQPGPDMSVTESNVYDPRFSGYGTSYRAYNEKTTGQTRFYYDDIDSVRMPNYISRSNIDFAKYADSYGSLHDNTKNGNQYNRNIRELAQESFLNSSLQQRNELSERLMRKRNGELWQLRKYPMRTFGGRKGC
jgi:hypothetical protein